MITYDVVVIGGGPAGLGAAIAADQSGAAVLLLEREGRLGGVLKQCIHDGFGLLRFGEKLSGCEYATRFIHQLQDTGVTVSLLTFASKIENIGEEGFRLTLVSHEGVSIIKAKTIVLATGCRERTAKQVAIHGTRPSGVLTAGAAQSFVNCLGQLPGKKCVILGSGDIGLIMARRLTLEGAEVLGVYEAKGEPSGLMRNIYQCLIDFDIPLHLSKTVIKTHGRERLVGVTVASVNEKMEVIQGTEEYIPCDTLILSVGLIPENELAESLNVEINRVTKGPSCDQNYMTSVPGVFSCGNAYHVNDLVDYVSESGEVAGLSAAAYAKDNSNAEVTPFPKETMSVTYDENFLYVSPQHIDIENLGHKLDFFFRAKSTMGKSVVTIRVRGAALDHEDITLKRSYSGLRPPEMEKITLDISSYNLLDKLTKDDYIEFSLKEVTAQ